MVAREERSNEGETLDRVDVDFAEAVAVFVASEFTSTVTNCVMAIAPSRQPVVDVIFVSHHSCPRGNRFSDDGLDGLLLDIGQHLDDDLAATLYHPEDGGLLFRERAAPALTFQSAAASGAPLFLTAAGWPLWPATI